MWSFVNWAPPTCGQLHKRLECLWSACEDSTWEMVEFVSFCILLRRVSRCFCYTWNCGGLWPKSVENGDQYHARCPQRALQMNQPSLWSDGLKNDDFSIAARQAQALLNHLKILKCTGVGNLLKKGQDKTHLQSCNLILWYRAGRDKIASCCKRLKDPKIIYNIL